MEGGPKRQYNLEERTATFAEAIITFAKHIPNTIVNTPMITQLVKAGTSQAANYYEAVEAESPNDFFHKIGISKKEIKETKLWLRLIARTNESLKPEARILWKEAHELNLIFNSIRRKRKGGTTFRKLQN
jgi:four helix bundle protein